MYCFISLSFTLVILRFGEIGKNSAFYQRGKMFSGEKITTSSVYRFLEKGLLACSGMKLVLSSLLNVAETQYALHLPYSNEETVLKSSVYMVHSWVLPCMGDFCRPTQYLPL